MVIVRVRVWVIHYAYPSPKKVISTRVCVCVQDMCDVIVGEY